jgi:hypothetical protein
MFRTKVKAKVVINPSLGITLNTNNVITYTSRI